MKINLKKIFTLFILFLFVFNIFGYYLPYLVLLSEVKSEMEEKMNEDNAGKFMVSLTFSLKGNEQPEWKEEGKEFRYKDEMYDVVKAEKHNDKITYYCLKDKEEKELVSNFNNLIKKNLNTEEKAKNNPTKELNQYNLDTKTELNPTLNSIQFCFFKPDLYKSLNSEIQSPPPKTA